jgi:hypothetical protein
MFSRIVLYLCILLCVGFAFVTVADAQSGLAVTSLDVSQTTVKLPCPPGMHRFSGECGDGMTVQAIARITARREREIDRALVTAVVTGGRVTNGNKKGEFNWDLTGAPRGTYTLTVNVAARKRPDRVVSSRSVSVLVDDCDGCRFEDSCPAINITGPAGITKPGEAMYFTANVAGTADELTYNWTVSAGKITSGQGTPAIQVDTTGVGNRATITATLTISGLAPICANSDSESGEVVAVY